jgi:two-component system response regulator GlrR
MREAVNDIEAPDSLDTGAQLILVVDDDERLLHCLALRLESAGYRVVTARSNAEALTQISLSRPDVLITDLCMDGGHGMDLVDAVQSKDMTLPIIVLTGHGSIAHAVELTKRGVFAYLTKPYDPDALLAEVRTAVAVTAPPEDVDGDWQAEIVTRSPLMRQVLRRASLIAATDARVLIQGPSGTGKELLARAIHRASGRRAGPFVAVNCAAIPEHLIESEMFGHAKGAFTGAAREHKGLFQAADGGTLFLDEIGDMPVAVQAKLLRVLEEQRVRPVGSVEALRVDARLITATHRDLDGEAAAGRFRHDLLYRISVARLALPSLAERREDIPLLASEFLRRFAERYGSPCAAFAPEALELLIGAPWPGNVRQFLHMIEQAVALCTTPIIPATLVQDALQTERPEYPPFEQARRQFERDYLVQLLLTTEGNVTRAAKLAQRNRTDVYKLLRRHGIEPSTFKR